MAEGWHPGVQNAKAAKEVVLAVLLLGVGDPSLWALKTRSW